MFMKFDRRKIIKVLGLSILSIFIPINYLFASAKKNYKFKII